MWQDPIVTETHALREQYANQFCHDADAIFQNILRRQNDPGKKLVSFPARKPISAQSEAQQGAPADLIRNSR
ncbi:MAG: hypothetical protein LM522_14025 [Candidatus Contendobacter sp.]|nr:hypothetical protein [Candidatus Contendobacter sp.]